MFLNRSRLALAGELRQCATNAETRIARLDYVIDIAILSSLIRIREEIVILLFLCCQECFRIFLLLSLFAVENSHSTTGTHHGNLSTGPSVVKVVLQLLTTHHDMTAAIALAQRHGHLRHRRFTISKEEFRAVVNHRVVLLTCTRQEAGNIDE